MQIVVITNTNSHISIDRDWTTANQSKAVGRENAGHYVAVLLLKIILFPPSLDMLLKEFIFLLLGWIDATITP